ncbi:hypothetical protein jhhlp_000840 [Lomentospora prolificans]|uniref:Rhodopsin domain-containing protein n=1 Tax=Lomentospora prolificans TaxID=41688 RepID=A0A2N3NJU9_9PEZI|nr:hypothetical protein jhhlp_000840 [Lomentospora prolificans]
MADSGAAAELPPGFNDNHSGVSIFIVVFCLFVSTLMVGLRIWTRKYIINQMGIDDWAAIITLLIVWGDGIIIALSTKYGLGRHVYAIDPTLIPNYLQCFWISIVLYCAALLAAKLTFLFQYYRIMAVQHMRKVYIIAIVIVGAWGLSQLLIGLLMCRPIQGFWDSTVEATCIPNYPQFYINAAGNIATDIAVFLLPIPVIKHLNLARTQRMILIGIFSLGFFTVAISVIRIKFLKQAEDITWENVESSGWSLGELTSALTCACLPTLRPLVSRFIPSLATAPQRSTMGYKKNTNNIDLESRNTARGNHSSARTDSVDDKSSPFDVRLTESKAETDDETGKWR